MPNEELWAFLKTLQSSGLTRQQKKTIRGQALAGEVEAARKGYHRLMRAKNRQREAK